MQVQGRTLPTAAESESSPVKPRPCSATLIQGHDNVWGAGGLSKCFSDYGLPLLLSHKISLVFVRILFFKCNHAENTWLHHYIVRVTLMKSVSVITSVGLVCRMCVFFHWVNVRNIWKLLILMIWLAVYSRLYTLLKFTHPTHTRSSGNQPLAETVSENMLSSAPFLHEAS